MTTPTGPERFEPQPPHPHPANAGPTQELPVAEPTEGVEPRWPVAGSAAPSYAGSEAPPPVANRARWSGRKTAVAAALAIGLTSIGAVAAASALPSGRTSVGDRDGFGPGGQSGRFGPGGQGGFGGQGGPGGQGGFGGRHRDGDGDRGDRGVDPNQQPGTGFDPSQVPGQTT
jgi:hypothetical protein